MQQQSDDEFRAEQIDELTKVDNVSEVLATRLIDQFGSVYGVSSWAASGWGALTVVDGMSNDRAKTFFHELNDAGVYVSIHDDDITMKQIRVHKLTDECNENPDYSNT